MNKVTAPLQSFTRWVVPRRDFALKGLVLLFLFGLILFPIGTSAQTGTSGQLTGNVTDQNGGVVPDATITATHTETGAKRTVTTNSDGYYAFTIIGIGTYRMVVTKQGFKETSVTNVVVNVANITRQDIVLEAGLATEVVNITAENVQVETQTGAIGEVISGEQVRELPLNGRSFVQLTQLQPGVSGQDNLDSKSKGLFGGVDFSVNGNSAQSNLFLTDGANNNDTGSNRTILLFPSIEAIAEFKSLRNSYGPEYGQAAGAVVSISTRGGSNEFHGSVFYFGRNDALNAAEFFAKTRGGVKDQLERHDYGFSIGGPIIKNRLFFFFSQEWNKETRGQARFGSVPTLLERAGNFSQPRFAANGARCSPNAITSGPGAATQILPSSVLSPGGLALLKLFPEPNASTGTCDNWSTSLNSPIDFRESNIRIDWNVTSKHKLFGRFTRDDWSNGYPVQVGSLWGDDAFPTVESNWQQPSQQAAFKLTSTLGSTSVNEIQFAYSGNRIIVDPGAGGDINREINEKVPGFFPDADKVNGLDRPHPVFWGGIAPYYSSSGSDLWAQIPFRNALDIYSIRDDFSTVKGNHTLRMGFLYDTSGKDEDSGPNNEATQFWGPGGCCQGSSGNVLADFLTRGTFFGFNETNTMPVGQTRYKNLEFYFGDSWKARPNLTLELGVRYSIFYEPYDARDLISSFSPEAYDPSRPASDPCNGLVVPKGTNPCAGIAGASTPVEASNRALRENNFKNFAPRLGVAWDIFNNGKTALRAGFGQFFLRERTSPIFAALTLNSPFAKAIAGERTLDTFAVCPNGQPPSAGTGRPCTVGTSAASNGSPRFGLSPGAATPYSFQYNVSIGHQLWKDTVLEVGYVGNTARNQLTHYDVNQVLPQNRVAAAFSANANEVNLFRPSPNYGSIYIFERGGRANYNSMQVLFRTRLAKALSLTAAYTFSKSEADFGLSDSSGSSSAFAVLNNNDRDLDLAESDINRPHIFVATFIYNLPKLEGSNAFVKTVLGGWEMTGIVQVQSGISITPSIGATGLRDWRAAQSFPAGVTGLGTGVANQRPLRVEGTPCTIEDPNGTRFVNPAAFTVVGYNIGTTSPKKSTCLGPPLQNVDFSLIKNFAPSWLRNSFFGEQSRIQLRLEMFNAFNTPQFRGDVINRDFYGGSVACGNAICSPSNSTITAVTDSAGVPLTQPYNGNFGVSTRTRGGREIQYALKFYF